MNKRKFVHSGPYPPPKPDHGLDWSALAEPTPSSSPGWPEPKSKPDPMPVSIEDQARFASMQMQNKVIESCKLFFNKRVHDEENNDGDDVDDEEEKNEVDMFLMRIFVNNNELRRYYDENHEKGKFYCLVCGGIGENVGKKFTGCVGLVQHCMSISKTKSRIGHRAFGLVVCEVLGWDCDRLPVILLKGEPLSRSLANSRESQDKNDDLKVILGNVESANADGSESVEREASSIDHSNGELMACNISNNSLKGADANENVESLEILDGEPNKGAANDLGLDSSQITTTEWPCIEPIEESTSTNWPNFKPCTAHVTHALSAEEKIRVNMVQCQMNVFEACKQFLSTTAESDSDEDDEFDEGEGEGEDVDGSKDSEEFSFFLRLFTENNGLRSYYETNCRGGDFWCLVCRGIGKKDWRTFKDCVGLIQHSTAISKTKRKRAHRAFGQVICKVLNWDIDHLPSIILKSEPQSRSLEDLSQDKGDDMDVILGNVKSANADGSESVEREASSIDHGNGELMACNMRNNSLKGDDANETVESLEISDGEPNQGAVNDQGLDSSQITTSGWPCIVPVDESTSTKWPSFNPCTAHLTHVLSAEEQIRVDMVQFQVNVFEACKQFLSTTAESDSDEDNEFDEGEAEDEDGSKDSEEFNFFLRLFTENNGLRSYYETNRRGGDFWCLVCRGIGKKDWRTFKDCVGLIQHSTAVSKTKKKRAHRAFGQVVCKVLNSDIDHLPSIILKSQPQSRSSEDLSQHDGVAGCDKDGSDAPMDKADSESGSKEDVDAHSK